MRKYIYEYIRKGFVLQPPGPSGIISPGSPSAGAADRPNPAVLTAQTQPSSTRRRSSETVPSRQAGPGSELPCLRATSHTSHPRRRCESAHGGGGNPLTAVVRVHTCRSHRADPAAWGSIGRAQYCGRVGSQTPTGRHVRSRGVTDGKGFSGEGCPELSAPAQFRPATLAPSRQ